MRGGYLGHMTKIPEQYFVLPNHGCLKCNFVMIGREVSKKKLLKIIVICINVVRAGADTPYGQSFYVNHLSFIHLM